MRKTTDAWPGGTIGAFSLLLPDPSEYNETALYAAKAAGRDMIVSA